MHVYIVLFIRKLTVFLNQKITFSRTIFKYSILILYFQIIIALLFSLSSQWEKVQKDDTDPTQLKGIKGSIETVTRDISLIDY